MSSTLYTQATKVINDYVEHYEGNWKEVRKQVLLDVDFLFREGTDGAKLYAYALDALYHELKPEGLDVSVARLGANDLGRAMVSRRPGWTSGGRHRGGARASPPGSGAASPQKTGLKKIVALPSRDATLWV